MCEHRQTRHNLRIHHLADADGRQRWRGNIYIDGLGSGARLVRIANDFVYDSGPTHRHRSGGVIGGVWRIFVQILFIVEMVGRRLRRVMSGVAERLSTQSNADDKVLRSVERLWNCGWPEEIHAHRISVFCAWCYEWLDHQYWYNMLMHVSYHTCTILFPYEYNPIWMENWIKSESINADCELCSWLWLVCMQCIQRKQLLGGLEKSMASSSSTTDASTWHNPPTACVWVCVVVNPELSW